MGLAIITGTSRGLGAALREEYESRGWNTIGFSRSGGLDRNVVLDLAEPEDSADVFTEAFDSLAGYAHDEVVVISNAAVLGPVGPVEHATPLAIEEHFATNVVSAILLARAFVSAFQDVDCLKTFVNISSGAATKGYAGWSLYCASKAAMENFVRSIALEQSDRAFPISAVSINPGVMDTAMQTEVRASSPLDFPQHERFMRLHAGGALAAPRTVASHIAEAVVSRPEPGGVYALGR